MNERPVSDVVARLKSKAVQFVQTDLGQAQRLLTWAGAIEEWARGGEAPPEPVQLAAALSFLGEENEAAPGNGAAYADSAEEPTGKGGWGSAKVDTDNIRVMPDHEFDMSRLHRFPGILPEAFQHPLDIAALKALKNVPVLDKLVTQLTGKLYERQSWLEANAQCLRISDRQVPSIYRKFQEAAAILDINTLPDIYVSTAYSVNATSSGFTRFQITLYSGLIELLTEDELLAVIGHELGHIKCRHMLYKTIANQLRAIGLTLLDQIPVIGGLGKAAAIPALLALLEWNRKAELSCDRAALLVVQKPEIVASALTKLAGGSPKILHELNLDAVAEQAQDFESDDNSTMTKLLRLGMMLDFNNTHPYPILRAREIMKWGASDEYREILAGRYKRSAPAQLNPVRGPVGFQCAQCASLSPVTALFCAKCGHSTRDAKRVCTNCQNQVQLDWANCFFCGSELSPKGKDSQSGKV